MKKNSQIHLFIETELKEKLKRESNTLNVSFSELCRQKLNKNDKLSRIELMVENINKKLNLRDKKRLLSSRIEVFK